MTEPLSAIPAGVRYYFGAEARARRAVEDAAMSVFDGWSYEEIATPAFDYLTLFERGMGREEARRAFRFADTDGRLLALRPDVTSSIGRAAATLFASRARPLRLCYAAQVFRQRPRSHAEWRRETTQLGCEFIGRAGPAADAEVLLIATEILERVKLPRESFRVTLNSVEVFNGVAERLALDPEARETMRTLVDARNAADLRAFLSSRGANDADAEAFCRLTQLPGGRDKFVEARRVIDNPRSVAALSELEGLYDTADALGLSEVFEIDFGDVSNLDYYTGLTFKIYVAGAGAQAGSGGRYDSLIENFGRREPAVGFMLDLDTLTEVLMRCGSSFDEDAATGCDASLIEKDDAAKLFGEARRRRATGARVRIGGEGS
jgi:ATP phosphoribosyltransferase regulatory subunit